MSPDEHTADSLSALLMKWEDLRRRGVASSPDTLCPEDPVLRDALRRQIGMLQALDRQFGVVPAETRSHVDGSAPAMAEETPPVGHLELHTGYVLERFHARGGLGTVYVARDKSFEREVAIKFSRRRGLSPPERARFQREAEITGRLEHPGIVPVYGLAAKDAEHACYVMRLVKGKTMQDAIDETHRPADPSSPDFQGINFRGLLQRLISICNTAAFAHEQGIIHRDIKPSNIMLGPFGETVLLD